jgi:hypothetical protein
LARVDAVQFFDFPFDFRNARSSANIFVFWYHLGVYHPRSRMSTHNPRSAR